MFNLNTWSPVTVHVWCCELSMTILLATRAEQVELSTVPPPLHCTAITPPTGVSQTGDNLYRTSGLEATKTEGRRSSEPSKKVSEAIERSVYVYLDLEESVEAVK